MKYLERSARGDNVRPGDFVRSVVLLMALVISMGSSRAGDPAWWGDYNLKSGTENNFAVANLGQLKNLAAAAVLELEQSLPGGAGADLLELVRGWRAPSNTTDNRALLNTGQLKNVVAMIYDRLIEEGYATAYPWDGSTSQPKHFAVALVGQLKHLFDYDIELDGDSDGVADMWEIANFGATAALTGTGTGIAGFGAAYADQDYDGVPDAQDPAPNDPDADGDGVIDGEDALPHDPRVRWSRSTIAQYHVVGSMSRPGSLNVLDVNDRGEVLLNDARVWKPKAGQEFRTLSAPAGALSVVHLELNNRGEVLGHANISRTWIDPVTGLEETQWERRAVIWNRQGAAKVLDHPQGTPDFGVSSSPKTLTHDTRVILETTESDPQSTGTNFCDVWVASADTGFSWRHVSSNRAVHIASNQQNDLIIRDENNSHQHYRNRQATGLPLPSSPGQPARVEGKYLVVEDTASNLRTVIDTSAATSLGTTSQIVGQLSAAGVGLSGTNVWINGQTFSIESLISDPNWNDGGGSSVGVTGVAMSERGAIAAQATQNGANFILLLEPWVRQDLALTVSEASGPRYRKVALNGSPLPDEKPQSQEESDAPKEETYVDAYNRSFHHHTTDVYVPLGASDLVMEVSRTVTSEVWNQRHGLRPNERVDRPFGPCWQSNICSYIEFVRRSAFDDGSTEPISVTVVDERGRAHPFGQVGDYFFPMPSGRAEKKAFLHRLEHLGGGTYLLRKKFGTTLTFQLAQHLAFNRDRHATAPNPDYLNQKQVYTYARLIEVSDRYGNTLHYEYNHPGTGHRDSLIPSQIHPGQGRSGDIQISLVPGSNPERVQSVRDPAGRVITYHYTANAPAQWPEPCLSRVDFPTAPTAPVETVSYDYTNRQPERDKHPARWNYPTPHTLEPDPSQGSPNNATTIEHLHLDLDTITDGRANRSTITYALDQRHKAFVKHQGENYIYVETGRPRIVAAVELPGSTPTMGQTTFLSPGQSGFTDPPGEGPTPSNTFKVVDATGSLLARRTVMVLDAQRAKRWYRYTDFETVPLDSLPGHGRPFDPEVHPLLVGYRQLDIISEYTPSGATTAESFTETFRFEPSAGYALSHVSDASGNVTEFAYQSDWHAPPEYRAILEEGYYGKWDDPSAEIDALGQRQAYGYDEATRVMNHIVDIFGNRTEYTIDSLGRRTEQRVYDGATLIQKTRFSYHATFKAFLTQKDLIPIAGFANDPTGSQGSWLSTLTTSYEPDSDGRRFKEKAHGVDRYVWNPATETNATLGSAPVEVRTITYDANGNQQTVTDGRGFTTTFLYDARNRLTQIIDDPASQLEEKTKFFYDAAGNKEREEVWVKDQSGTERRIRVTLLAYDALNRLEKQAVDINHDQIINTGDQITILTYNWRDSVLTVVDPLGTETLNQYDEVQRLIETTAAHRTDVHSGSPVTNPPEKAQTRFFYDFEEAGLPLNPGASVFHLSGFQPTKTIDPRGIVSKARYDAIYRVLASSVEYEPGTEATTTYDYALHTASNEVRVTDAQSKVTRIARDALGREILIERGVGSADKVDTRHTYTSTGLLWKSQEDAGDYSAAAVSRVTTRGYNLGGQQRSLFHPDPASGAAPSVHSPVQTTFYDKNGNLAIREDPRGNQWHYHYDSKNRQILEVAPAVFDAENQQSHVHPKLRIDYGLVLFDSQWRRESTVSDARQNATVTRFDRAGRAVYVQQPTEDSMPHGSNTPSSQSHIIRTEYDPNGNPIKVTDAEGFITLNTYDSLNRLVSTTTDPADGNPEPPSATNITVEYQYDPVGNQRLVIDGKSQKTEFQYDGLNRVTAQTFDPDGLNPASRTTTFAYDGVNKIRRTDALGQVTDYGYDDLHRLKTTTWVGALQGSDQVWTHTYDRQSNLRTVDTAGTAADVSYTYDFLNRVTSETSAGIAHGYQYDKNGNRTAVFYHNTAAATYSRKLALSYDALNRLESCTETPLGGNGLLTSYQHDLNGNVVRRTLPNSVLTTTTYDALNRKEQMLVTKTASILQQFDYEYDRSHNVREIIESYDQLGSRSLKLTYDAAYRLRTEASTVGASTSTATFTYDKANNRTLKSVSNGGSPDDTTYNFGGNVFNQLQSITLPDATVISYGYNNNGNRTTRTIGAAVDTYAYDFENRLVSLDKNTGGGNGNYSYLYDHRSRRVQRTEPGVGTTKDSFVGGTKALEYTGSSSSPAIQVEYVRGSDFGGGGVGGLLYSVRGTNRAYTHFNSRGDVTAKTNASGSVSYQVSYDSDGKRLPNPFATTLDKQSANTKYEDPTGLLNEGFRIRDLEAMVFLTRDPAGFVDGPNLYTYVNQNPWTKFDPHGLQEMIANRFSQYQESRQTGQPIGEIIARDSHSRAQGGGAGLVTGAAVLFVAKVGVVAAAKEGGSEVFEHYTGIPTSIKDVPGLVKGGWKKLKDVFSPNFTSKKANQSGAINPQGKSASQTKAETDTEVSEEVTTLRDPSEIELSHPVNLSTPFSNPAHGTVGDLAQNLRKKKVKPTDIPAVEVVKIRGKEYSANNRRLRAFQEAEVNIPTKPASREQKRKVKQRLRNKN